MKNTLVMGIISVLSFCGGLLQAEPITIQISGNVTSASGSALPSTIHSGISFTGIYTYDSSTADSGGGHYIQNAPYGIDLFVGGYEFKTAPNHVGQFDIRIANDLSINGIWDYYSVRSEFQNISIPDIGPTISYIRWDLGDNTHTALSSGNLPISAPVLSDWNSNVLEIYGFGSGSLLIDGKVNQATLIPEPTTGILMMMGMFLLRRKR
jgi:hypothetical protein